MSVDLCDLVMESRALAPDSLDLLPVAACSAAACRFHAPKGLFSPQLDAVLTEVEIGDILIWACGGNWTFSTSGLCCFGNYGGELDHVVFLGPDARRFQGYLLRMAKHLPRKRGARS
jgi:hypothetical protein